MSRVLIAWLLLAACAGAAADYIIAGPWTVTRYRDDGTVLVEYGYDSPGNSRRQRFIDERVHLVAADAAANRVYTVGRTISIGMPFRAFDLHGGQSLTPSDPWGEPLSEAWLDQRSIYGSPEDEIDPPGCNWLVQDRCAEPRASVGLIESRIGVDSDGVVWGYGTYDRWRFDAETGVATLDESDAGVGLHRYDPDADGSTRPFLKLPLQLMGSPHLQNTDPGFAIRPDDVAFVQTPLGAIEVRLDDDDTRYPLHLSDLPSFDDELVERVLSSSGIDVLDGNDPQSPYYSGLDYMHPLLADVESEGWQFRDDSTLSWIDDLRGRPTLMSYETTTKTMLAPIPLPDLAEGSPVRREGEFIVGSFFDDLGNVIAILNRRPDTLINDDPDLIERRTVWIDGTTGRFLRSSETTPGFNYFFEGLQGVYVRVIPEPAGVFALILASTLTPRRLNHAHR